MKTHSGNTLIPVVIIILSIAAVVGVFAFSIWPTDKEFTSSTVRVKVNANLANGANNANTPVVNDETKDWETYMNSENGFSFKYPNTWDVAEETDLSHGVKVVIRDPSSRPEMYLLLNGDHGGSQAPYTTWTLVKGLEGFDVESEQKSVGNSDANYIRAAESTAISSSQGFDIDFRSDGKIAQSAWEAIAKNILSTFKFTDPTAGWKTYTAPTAGYSFQYPDGLGNAEIEGSGYLGSLEGQKAKEWEQNLLVIDSDKVTQIIYFYVPPADQTTLEQEVSAHNWNDTKLFKKTKEIVNGVNFDVYTAIGTPYNYDSKGYAVTHGNHHYLIALKSDRLHVAEQILSTFTFTN